MFFRGKKEEPIENLAETPKPKPKKVEKVDDGLVWDKKRLFVALVIVIIAFFAFMQVKKSLFPGVSILGDSTVKKASEIQKPIIGRPNVDLESQVTSSLDDIKNNVNGIDPQEVATSSPQIQKVLRDIEGLKDLPSNQAKSACLNICSKL
jgi:hypothetical protein